jgi:CHAD domain-containing protein
VLHDWRKRVKYFYYQLCALPPQKGVSYHEEMEALRLLGSLLGKVHDLDVLAAYLRTEGHENEPVRRLVTKRRVRLVKKIRRLYDELFFRSTRQFRKMIESA